MNKKILKAGAFILALSLTLGLIFFANALVGNPISRLLADHNAEKYISETYPGQGFELEKVRYSFKDGNYNITVDKPESLDYKFYISYDFFGNLVYDSYEYYIAEKANTSHRLWDEYRNLTKSVIDNPSFPLEMDFGYGELKTGRKDENDFLKDMPVTLKQEDLVLDKIYDIRLLGKNMGVLNLYVFEEEISKEQMAEDLLAVKKAFDENSVPFYAVDLHLRKPKREDSKRDSEELSMLGFLYDDIKDDDELIAKVEAQIKKTEDYYNRMDNLKKQEE